ncbi:MAG: trypsin-like peptidase domain-containing protein [Akkermansiaceae bacterium]
MSDTIKRIFVLGLVFAVAFLSVYVFRAWRDGHPIFGIGEKRDPQQYSPENATLASESALDASQVPGLVRVNEEMTKLVDAVVPSVVSIDTKLIKKERFLDPFGGRVYERSHVTPGLGSGVIISSEGHVVTNHHVIAGHQEIRVTLNDRRSLPAILIDSDPLVDIAVLRIKGQPGEVFKPLKFADSDQVKVGQLAIAVGNPYGFQESVTTGRISARDRSFSDGQGDKFQTDAAINPGNSGGPLLNHLGEIIGINASIWTTNRDDPSFGGIGFSIPSNDVVRTMTHILEKGRPVYGFLGIQARDLNQHLRNVFDYQGRGVFIWDVSPGSPAALAGIKQNDIVTAYAGEGVENARQFIGKVQRSRIDEEVIVSVWRGSGVVNIKAVVKEANPFGASENAVGTGRLASDEVIVNAIGLQVQSTRRAYGGVIVKQVLRDSYAQQKGILPGDLILEINGSRIQNEQDFMLKLVATAAVQQTNLLVVRGRRSVRIDLPQVPRAPSD